MDTVDELRWTACCCDNYRVRTRTLCANLNGHRFDEDIYKGPLRWMAEEKGSMALEEFPLSYGGVGGNRIHQLAGLLG